MLNKHLAKARCVVAITFDFDAESAEMRKTPHSPVKLSKGQFGARVGVTRILRLLDHFAIKSTFFTPAWTAQKYEDQVRSILRAGHELAAHGYLHENFSELTPDEENRVMEKTLNVFRSTSGASLKGFRAPYWELTARTLPNLVKFGFLYDSSLMSDDAPYIVSPVSGKKIVELPVEWFLDDWPLFEIQKKSPDEVYSIWESEFDAVYEEEVRYFMLTAHPECIGRLSRLRMLSRLIQHAMEREGTVFARCDEIAESYITLSDTA